MIGRVRASGPLSPLDGAARATLTLVVDAAVLESLPKGSLVEIRLLSASEGTPLAAAHLVQGPASRAESTPGEASPVGDAGSHPAGTEPRAVQVRRGAEARRRRATPEERAKRAASRHPSFTDEARAAFCLDLSRLELGAAGDLDVVSAWCEDVSVERVARGLAPVLRPSHRDPRERQKLLEVLRTGPLRERLIAWANEPVPVPQKATPQTSRCSCGVEIVFVPLKGKPHPCNPAVLRASKGGRGRQVALITDEGTLHTGLGLDPEGAITGRESHFSSCPDAEQHRKRKTKTTQENTP